MLDTISLQKGVNLYSKMYALIWDQLMKDSIATDNVWYDETSNLGWCQSRIWGGLHPLGEVIDGDQDELVTTRDHN